MEGLNFETGQGVERYAETLRLIDKLEEINDDENISSLDKTSLLKDGVKELIDHINIDFHIDLDANVSAIYEEMSKQDLLARVEKVKNVIECLAENVPIKVGDEDHHYANSVTADKEGLRIALAEGEAIGPIRLIVGLDLKALIGFSNDHIKVEEIDNNDFDLRDTNLRTAYCRHIVGEIHSEDIKYFVMRIPRSIFPEGNLLDFEKKHTSPFIFRGARLENIQNIAKAA